MKVLVVTSVYALSETDRNGSFLVEAVRHLKRRGHEVTVLAPSYEGRSNHLIDEVPVHRFRYFFKKWENLTHMEGAPNRIQNPLYLFIAFFYIIAGLVAAVRLAWRDRFDVIHAHWPFPHGVWAVAAGRMSGARVVLTFHGAELLLARKFPFIRPVIRFVVRRAYGVTTNSTFTARQVLDIVDCNVNVVPFGTTVEAIAAAKCHAKPVKDIMFAGRFIARKGVDYLIRAMPAIVERVPCHLHLVGGGPKEEEWRRLAEELGVRQLLTFHGVVPNEILGELYRRADVFVLPAIIDRRGDTEGLGVVLVEALSFGTPVVATDVGGIPDVVIDGVTGRLVPEKSAAALADAVVDLLAKPDCAEAMSVRGLAHARSYFDWGRIMDLTERVYGFRPTAPIG